ncbi:MAG: 4-alpha-glucanotransferase, partial [Candidatus Aminicenantes bacterium]|nr:4-alpha-glucanotransferase [Candidatus Aminicenantes bacterium]
MKERASGILLHISSLPGPFGIGDFGPEAYRFIDFLYQTKQIYWQILPLNPVDPAFGNSPYTSTSAFAGNPIFISPELLVRDGYMDKSELRSLPEFTKANVDYKGVIKCKKKILRAVFEQSQEVIRSLSFQKFCSTNRLWLDDFALFVAIKAHYHRKAWSGWPPEIRDRKPRDLLIIEKHLQKKIAMAKFYQFLFWEQWFRLKEYAHDKGILILGDMPIYVVHDSVDVWMHPDFFKLDVDKMPYAVAGVPPDYFSRTGQLWGNPLYRWDVLREQRYDWWIDRLEHNFRLYDFLRIDHFRGFVGYWEIPASERYAVRGKWMEAPGMDFFTQIKGKFPALPIIAEDLGVITPDVRQVMEKFGFPGMKVLLFAFGDDDPMHPYLPHTYEKNCVVYTGTHDNNTVKGWFENEADGKVKSRVFRYLGRITAEPDIHREFIRMAMMSPADTAILPVQDILGLGEAARMNRPAKRRGNWEWRLAS